MPQLPLLLPLSVDTSPPELKLLSKILGTFEKQLFLMLKNLQSWRIMGLWYFELRIQIHEWLIYSHFPRLQSLNLLSPNQQNLLILQSFSPIPNPHRFSFHLIILKHLPCSEKSLVLSDKSLISAGLKAWIGLSIVPEGPQTR